jgi:peptidoglycan hydrolase CwlO-like protein
MGDQMPRNVVEIDPNLNSVQLDLLAEKEILRINAMMDEKTSFEAEVIGLEDCVLDLKRKKIEYEAKNNELKLKIKHLRNEISIGRSNFKVLDNRAWTQRRANN